MNKNAILGAIIAGGLIGAAPAPDGTLTVRVDNVRNAKGRVHIDVCPEDKFLKKDCPWSAVAPARAGETIVVVHGVPAGNYAVQAFHDENGNNKVDRVIFGLPKEGVGFSNDAPIKMSAPKWAAAVFAFDGRGQAIRLKLRYFL